MRNVRVNNGFHLEPTEMMSADDFLSLPVELMAQYLTAKEYFLDYIPRRFRNIPQQLDEERQLVLGFKRGDRKDQLKVVGMVARFLLGEWLGGSEFTLMCIPASSALEHKVRFELFMKNVTKITHNINGYELVKVLRERHAVHAGGSRSSYNYFISPDVAGRKVILFDDVETTGLSFASFSSKLESMGASVVQGVFLAKTTFF